MLCGPVYVMLWTQAILSHRLDPAPSTKRLRLLDLSEIWPWGSLLLPQAPANLWPLHWVSIWKVRRDRRGGQGGLLWSFDMVTDSDYGVVRFRVMARLFFTDQTPTPPRLPHILCPSVGVRCYMSVSFFMSVFPSVCVLFPSLTVHTDHAGYDVCTAGLDRAVQEMCGLQIPCWHTDLTCLSLFRDLEF